MAVHSDCSDSCCDQFSSSLEAVLAQIQAFTADASASHSQEDAYHGLEQVGGNVGSGVSSSVQRREKPHPPRIDAHRFSRANLEDSGDVELDAILGELCALETQFDFEISSKTPTSSSNVNVTSSTKTTTTGTHIIEKMQPKQQQQQQPQQGHYQQLHPQQQRQSHSRSNSGNNSRPKFEPLNVDVDVTNTTMARTDSPDNDSAFSDNVSMLSSESSASSGASGSAGSRHDPAKHATQAEQAAKLKAEKIKMALEKIKEANVKKLFIKAFTSDGSTKSLLVDEKMTVVHVTRLLADKNHVRMDPKWAVVEHIPDLYMERIYEDDEMLVENLLLWTRDSKNKLLFLERPDKYDLFLRPEQYILIGSSSQKNSDLDDEGRNTLIEEFFSSTGVGVPEVEGPLFLKSEGKKVWKKYYFVLRASGLYYCPKGKSSRSSKDLVCLTTLEVNQVYYGVGWKKKYKAPSDWCFAIKHPHLQAKSSKYIKYLCAEDPRTLAQWVMGIRIAKSGKRLLENYRALVEDLAQEDIDMLASSRSFSIASMAGQSHGSQGPSQATTPSSESRSLDSCLAPSLTPSVVDGDDGGDDAHSSAGSSSQDTPVNTLGRTPVWRQDSLKSGSSSSSSGCLSERSSAGTPTGEHGFESEFPQGTIKRKPSSNPKLPLTSTTRLLVKEVEGEDAVDSAGRGSAVRQSVRRSITEEVNTLRRRNSATTQSRSSVSSSSSSNVVNNSMTSPVPQEEEMDSLPLPPPPPELAEPCAMELLPPPPPELLASTLSLNSLPPPPDEASLPPINPEDLMMASITSLPPPPPPSPPKPCSPPHNSAAPPLPAHSNVVQSATTATSAPNPPPHGLPLPPPTTPKPSKPKGPGSPIYGGSPVYQTTGGSPVYQTTGSPVYQAVTPPAVAPKPRRDSSDSATYSSPPYLAELRAHNGAHQNGSSPVATTPTSSHNGGGWHPDAPLPPPPQSPTPAQPVYAQPQKSPQKKVKRITFLDDVQNIPPTPDSPTSKPPLPRRSESTRLSIPGRLDSPGSKFTPPRSFLNNLQRVMQKKWQVAQKCKDFDKMPHEVLGFRDPILPSEAERNVGAWIQEHYGSLYENLSPHGSPPQPSSDNVETLQPTMGGSYTLQPSPPPHAEDLHRLSQTTPCRKKPPPPPPKRSDSTQLSTRQ